MPSVRIEGGLAGRGTFRCSSTSARYAIENTPSALQTSSCESITQTRVLLLCCHMVCTDCAEAHTRKMRIKVYAHIYKHPYMLVERPTRLLSVCTDASSAFHRSSTSISMRPRHGMSIACGFSNNKSPLTPGPAVGHRGGRMGGMRGNEWCKRST